MIPLHEGKVNISFGWKNGPSVFQIFMTHALKDLIRAGDIVVYMNDFLNAITTPDTHFQILYKLLEIKVK